MVVDHELCHTLLNELKASQLQEAVDGPLATCQIARASLSAKQAIGAGQFGEVRCALFDRNLHSKMPLVSHASYRLTLQIASKH